MHARSSVPLMAAVLLTVFSGVAVGQPYEMGTAFTYQGRLEFGGSAVTDTCDFEFTLWDDLAAGSQKGSAVPLPGVTVEDGLFTAELDFGEEFNGQARWLQMAVCCPSTCTPVALTPRMELTPAPHAMALPGLYTQQNATSPNVIGGHSANTVAAGVHGATIGGGGDTSFPNSVLGNYGTVGGGAVNTASGYTAATVGGGYSNTATAGYATVGGGYNNTASATEATVGGGSYNTAENLGATVGGGRDNTASGDWMDDYPAATVGGGYSNTASGSWATVGGGSYNTAGGEYVIYATVSGGYSNTASGSYATVGGGWWNIASGLGSTVPGGYGNTASGHYSFAAGRKAKAINDGSFVWSDSGDTDFSSTGTNQFLINAAGGVGIGIDSPSEALDVSGNIHASGTIASGSSITIDGTSGSEKVSSSANLELLVSDGRALRIETHATSPNLVGGHSGNSVGGGVYGATIGGGGDTSYPNSVTANFGTVGGGNNNTASGGWATVGGGVGGDASGYRATVAGGSYNTASGNYATVPGGSFNSAEAESATVGGGEENTATRYHATVVGGLRNLANGDRSTVGGGEENTAAQDHSTVGGGYQNSANRVATVGGGSGNDASGQYATIPGGTANTASGDYSFAAGRQAKAINDGSFVWSDSGGTDFSSTGTNQFLINAAGGVGIGTTSPSAALDVVGTTELNGDVTVNSNLTVDTDALFVDGTASQVGIGTTSPSAALDVVGTTELNGDVTVNSNLTVDTDVLFVDGTAGQVGIGTTSPQSLLHLKSYNTDSNTSQMRIDASSDFGAATYAALEFKANAASAGAAPAGRIIAFYPALAYTAATMTFQTIDSDIHGPIFVDVMSLRGGKVGIGRTPTANILEVEGNASKTTAGDWLANSDRRIKTDIETVDGALEKLDQVRLVSFDYTDTYRAEHAGVEDRRYVNVIAQEFADVFPEYVRGSGERLLDGEEILQVDTYPLTIYSAAAIQELHAEVKQRDAQIAELEEDNDMLEARLAALEKLMKLAITGQDGGVR